jgi:hypothetical protein
VEGSEEMEEMEAGFGKRIGVAGCLFKPFITAELDLSSSCSRRSAEH